MLTRLTLFLSVLLTTFACAQTRPGSRTISGTVRDAQSFSPLPGVTVMLKGTKIGATSDTQGRYRISLPGRGTADSLKNTLVFSFVGYKQKEIRTKAQTTAVDVALHADNQQFSEVVVGYGQNQEGEPNAQEIIVAPEQTSGPVSRPQHKMAAPPAFVAPATVFNEEYGPLKEDGFRAVRQQPVTTFSADVDRAAYANVRRFLNAGQRPPKDAVRIEEMVNYFQYDLPQPAGHDPVSITTELTESPYNPGLKLLRIGLQARTVPTDNLPPANLTFLIDVSGSMSDPNKLPLVKATLHELLNQLRPVDRVALVVYAGAAGVVLPATPGDKRERIREAINNLQAGGSTAGGEGIQLAYKIARQNFRRNGNNRVILATDGDFNVGISGVGELEKLVEQERESGVFLSVLGFGMGNYKDQKLETLADKGDGNYAYIDNMQEARKVFGQEFGGTLFTVAKDVKLQLEFNPRHVSGYRLIGYENRRLNNEDFDNDRKDAGDLGSGHTVTALYELIPTGLKSNYLPTADQPLKYQRTDDNPTANTDEWLTLKVRYKDPTGHQSKLLTHAHTAPPVPLASTTADCRFAVAVAGFGLVLRESEFQGKTTFKEMATLARGSFGSDAEGYRRELVRLIGVAEGVKER